VDDLKIFREIRTTQDIEDLKADIGALEHWTTKNHLPLNVKKCKVMTFTRRREPIYAQYSIQGEQLERVHETRDLGVIMEGNLKFTKQFQKIETMAKKTIGLIRRFSRTFRDPSTMRLLYLTLVRSHFDFANVIWGPLGETEIKVLESQQKKFF